METKRKTKGSKMKTLAILHLLPLFCCGEFQSISIQLPPEAIENIKECEENAKEHPVDIHISKLACIHAYYSTLGPRELTASDSDLIKQAQESSFGKFPPPSGFRTRRELRTLSETEWNDFTDVIISMYKNGILKHFGKVHGDALGRYHKGAAFLPWHRVFITYFEEQMRKVNPHVFLPYWDYTIDNNITQPAESVVWTDCFFGNGKGPVSSGPFKNFYGGQGNVLSRDCARKCASKLINKIDISHLNDYCYFENVTTGSRNYSGNRHNIEVLHNGVHNWIGGDMGIVAYSAYDPIFYLHHAFIDYIWEHFRENQIKQSCGYVDIETDYRPLNDLCQNDSKLQGPDDPMWGFAYMPIKNGLSRNWTKYYFNYAPQPSCPDNCNGEYLYCDTDADPRYPQGLCMTKTKDACKRKNVRQTRAATDDTDDLVPTLPCSAGIKLIGLPGDGRTRETSEEKSKQILQKEIARGIHTDKPKDNVPENTAGASVGFTFLGFFLGIAVCVGGYCFIKRRSETQYRPAGTQMTETETSIENN